jgi:hypothetical protein
MWMDDAYAMHHSNTHTGAGMSSGQGMGMSYSWKQKVNTKSSTKAELVGVNNSLGYILWTRYFLQEKRYDLELLLLHKGSMSTILLKINGKRSSSKCTKHIKKKYYYMKDKINQGEFIMEHCPMEQI